MFEAKDTSGWVPSFMIRTTVVMRTNFYSG